MQLSFGITEGAIGSNFSFYEGDVLTIIATYEFQNPQQVAVTQWSYNGLAIDPSFTNIISINGSSYRTYLLQMNNVNVFLHRAINFNKEIIEFHGLSPQSNSEVEFQVSCSIT